MEKEWGLLLSLVFHYNLIRTTTAVNDQNNSNTLQHSDALDLVVG